MRLRGDIFWEWADPELHWRTLDETLNDGTHIDVQVRLSRAGETQMFIGIYAPDGMALHEVAVDSHPGESMTRVLAGVSVELGSWLLLVVRRFVNQLPRNSGQR